MKIVPSNQNSFLPVNNASPLVIRNRKLWEYYKFTSKYKKLSFYEVKDDSKSLGYFVITNNVIYEIY